MALKLPTRRGGGIVLRMIRSVAALLAPLTLATLALAPPALAQQTPTQQAPESVYAPPELPRDDEGLNLGAVHFDLGVYYFSNYIYRGVNVFDTSHGGNSLNLQIDGKLSFDLGKLPHPFVEVFTNIANEDPISNFQEIRPTVGFDWEIKPLIITTGYTTYLYPERDERQTSEVFFGLSLDDKILFSGTAIPVPYAMAVYDFDLYDGLYIETGLKYRLAFDDIGLAFTATGSIGYVSSWAAYIPNDAGTAREPGFFTDPDHSDSHTLNGFQHYQIGLMAEYSLNKLFNVSTRFGQWSLRGYLNYTDGLDNDIGAATLVWGGGGINFSY